MSEEKALEFFYQAIAILDKAGGNLSDRDRRDAISLFKLATNKVNNVFPRAHSLLAMIHYELGDSKSAEIHAKTALEQDEFEFRAQFVKVQIAIDNVQVMTGSASSLLPRGIGAVQIIGSVFRTGKAAVSAGQVSITQLKFKEEVNKLMRVFQLMCDYEELPATEFSYCAEQLMSLADFIIEHNIPMPGGKPNVYNLIASSSIDNLAYDDDYEDQQRNDVNLIRNLAEGRSLSFRP